jgi:hypothetical protein
MWFWQKAADLHPQPGYGTFQMKKTLINSIVEPKLIVSTPALILSSAPAPTSALYLPVCKAFKSRFFMNFKKEYRLNSLA